MSAAIYNIEIEQDTDWSDSMVWKTGTANTIVNLTGYTAKMYIKSTYSSSTYIATLTTENGCITLGGVLGTITLSLSNTVTKLLPVGSYVYDLTLISSGGQKYRLIEGYADISPASD